MERCSCLQEGWKLVFFLEPAIFKGIYLMDRKGRYICLRWICLYNNVVAMVLTSVVMLLVLCLIWAKFCKATIMLLFIAV